MIPVLVYSQQTWIQFRIPSNVFDDLLWQVDYIRLHYGYPPSPNYTKITFQLFLSQRTDPSKVLVCLTQTAVDKDRSILHFTESIPFCGMGITSWHLDRDSLCLSHTPIYADVISVHLQILEKYWPHLIKFQPVKRDIQINWLSLAKVGSGIIFVLYSIIHI